MFKIKNADLVEEIVGEAKSFPKYTTQIINIANKNAQGTRPKVVGQLSELIQECPHKDYVNWKKWYLQKQNTAITDATDKIMPMIEDMKKAINLIDKKMVKLWVEDLVLDKTFIGLRFQEAIIKRLAEIRKTSYRLANPDEESKGIDGFIGDIPVSIKPITYKTKDMLNEEINVKIVFYEKKKDGINVDDSQL